MQLQSQVQVVRRFREERVRKKFKGVITKDFNDVLYYLWKARYDLIRMHIFPKPETVAKMAYVLVEDDNTLPHATKYRYKAFLRWIGYMLLGQNIAVRKAPFRKSLKRWYKKVQSLNEDEYAPLLQPHVYTKDAMVYYPQLVERMKEEGINPLLATKEDVETILRKIKEG